ncbi:MAG: threonylcarbamoyl-AMP synthase [Candidatus Marinimicrobia bacterium]|mgnify:FL=1|nr:threonylcarbamoyl-AMP synthase [Candidatus Neomarinimicrobiota bacterium]|tara:strand:+ start:986 stop:1570 length:585 start_codon:yes stop_codon:yes gene_type:complete
MIVKENQINSAIKTLNEGNILIYPTDTLYGLGADATNTSAIEKINKLKKRKTPLSIMVSSLNEIEKYAVINSDIKKELKKVFPGPFTALLQSKKTKLSYLVQNQSDKIGIRIPNHPFCLDLLNEYKKPIITTSVNTHGEKALNNINEIEKKFSKINIYYQNNNLDSKGSTIIDFTKKPPILIRMGDGKYNYGNI